MRRYLVVPLLALWAMRHCAPAQLPDLGVAVAGLSGRVATLDEDAVARLAAAHVTGDFQGEHGRTVAAFDGHSVGGGDCAGL